MLAVFLLLQLALPLGIIAWVLWAPARSRVGFGVQLAATALILLALARLGLWVVPPWWMPRVYAVLLFAAAIVALRRRPPLTTWPAGTGPLALVALFLAGGGLGAVLLGAAWGGRRVPVESPFELAIPFDSGRYLVLNGGSSPRINAHLKLLDTTVARFATWRGSAHGVDLVAISASGLRARGVRPADPAAYESFGMPVMAPCGGHVVAAVGGFPDLPVGEIDSLHRAGNHVIIRCDDVDVVLAHFRSGSVRVDVGDFVVVGQPVGEMGNSGASDEPHLHIHAQHPGQDPGAPLAAEPLPIRIGGLYLVRGDRIRVTAGRAP